MGVYKLSTAGGLATPRTNYSSFLAGNPAYEIPTSYESIATVTVGSGGVADITFSSIPSTYTHLQIRMLVQETRSTYGISEAILQFNSDTTSGNYKSHGLFGDASTTTANTNQGTNGAFIGDGTLGTQTGGTFGAAVVDILDYANTNKNTTVRSISGVDLNGTVAGYGGRVGLFSSLWLNTSAITTIKISPAGGTDFRQYTQFALYGIKGS
jgi:hypothetical protein